ncbi:MAG: ABC transporter ATP-binding protein [Acidimicrobiia bacterium]|nr:ABC transporter ATP-binding protein [Acidimicrobiia bacterium]
MRGAGSHDSEVPVVELCGITKRFGDITACEQVDLTLHRGRIHGILGENGAGKSTLMKGLIGLVLPDAGLIRVNGQICAIHDPLIAAELGIAMVHQHFSLVEHLTVWENVALGESGRLNSTEVRRSIEEIVDLYGLEVDYDAQVGELSVGLRQRVEIIKCLCRDPDVLVLDEPTSVLTPDESAELFSTLREVVAEKGSAVGLVSHKLDEVLSVTDEITVMRDGRVVASMLTEQVEAGHLAKAMVGREVALSSLSQGSEEPESFKRVFKQQASPLRVGVAGVVDTPVLQLEGVTGRGRGQAMPLNNLSLELYAGEIVGVAGVAGSGQRTLADLLSSLVSLDAGRVLVNGTEVLAGKPGAMAKAGVAVISEDRHDSGVVLEMSVAENLFMATPHRVARCGVINQAQAHRIAREMINEFSISCSGPEAPMWSLSGGSRQRVVLARELAASPDVLVAAQPTGGLDVGAIEYIIECFQQAVTTGMAVLWISSDLEEILSLSQRMLVMAEGRIVGEMSKAEASLEALSELMDGGSQR